MKKKVLALVVLAAMLISILPMAVFAVPAAADEVVSKVYVSTDSAVADGEDELEFDVNLINASGDPVTRGFYVATSRPSVDKIYVDGTYYPFVNGIATIPGATGGWTTVNIVSSAAGTTKVAVGLVDTTNTAVTPKVFSIKDYLNGVSDATYVNSKALVNASSGNYITSLAFTTPDTDAVAVTATGFTVVAGQDGTTEDTAYTGKVANGSGYYEIIANVKAGISPVSGADVKFSINKSGATLTATDKTTDTKGEAKVKITATKPGTYKVTAKSGDKEGFVYVKFGAATIDSIKAASSDNQKIALNESNVTLKYTFYDGNGNKITPNSAAFTAGNDLAGAELTVLTKPSGAAIKDSPASGTDYTATLDDGNLKIVIPKAKINKAGDYEIKLALINGKSITYKFNVKKMGDVTGMTLEYDTTTLAAKSSSAATGAKTDVPEVKLVDAEGYKKDATASNVKFTVDNATLAKVDNNSGSANFGQIEVISEDPGVVTVTAIDTDSKQVATATITIVKAAAALKLTAAPSNTVGQEATVTVQLIDVDGKAVALGSGSAATATDSYVVLSKPDGAIVSTNNATSLKDDVQESGKYEFEIISNVAGDVKVQAVLEINGTTVYTGSAIVTFGAGSGITGKNIIFMIGSSSYLVDGKPVVSTSTPFIENGRTYLGVRDIGMSMGITGDENIVWNNATQTAKLVKDGITVEVTVGASAIKVTKNNVTTEVAIDAPAQNKAGRVYLPFRPVFEAFGYAVEYANGVITCI
ncbi:MAG: stalk domain-containing protein [Peptococcaceae bacterium]|nr:stalk domain-containing protein [Peptococcaceae bacterium]